MFQITVSCKRSQEAKDAACMHMDLLRRESEELSVEARRLVIDASNKRREKGEAEKAWLLLLADSSIHHLGLPRLWLLSGRNSSTWSEDRGRRSTGEDDSDREKTDAAGNDFQRP
ncbi:hypothetical protein B296_00017882 [Ensete ventricosum]|uniref:Uncharacterized protein n=1 Tax=Ensete ventricosum TaxID=4639 RepID=A0A426ZRJ7_ENSVE|nr:hypothetical protein B296_00017882 [Ensete ventricosum]